MVTKADLDEMIARGDEDAILTAFEDDVLAAHAEGVFPRDFGMFIWNHPSGATVWLKDVERQSHFGRLTCDMCVKVADKEFNCCFSVLYD